MQWPAWRQPRWSCALVMGLVLGLATAGVLACAGEGSIHVLVPYAAGGSTDIATRHVAHAVAARLHRALVVVNVPGASGLIAVRHLLGAPRDGCTLLSAALNTVVLLPLQNPHAGFTSADLLPLGRTGETGSLIVASTASGLRDMASLQQAVRSGRTLHAGHPGLDTIQALTLDALQLRLNVRFVQVPYNGAAPMVNDLAGGHIDIAAMAQPAAVALVQRGAAVVLGRGTLGDGAPLRMWSGWFAAQGVPAAALQPVQTALQAAMLEPAVQQAMADLDVDLAGNDHQHFAEEIAASGQRLRVLLGAASRVR